ncbi:hypothetical protein JD844_023663 [Phrynosoma platyrhinos]|uniref:Leucine-rich repeat-containing protein 63 n=1 Tax=Phrynosoma platyrhinos TaxID=52577 RepID=A0ABQ7SXA9_PHRPL|nr:hypothetical protein JD844_023663 [Phrynosoma platyrhinos]
MPSTFLRWPCSRNAEQKSPLLSLEVDVEWADAIEEDKDRTLAIEEDKESRKTLETDDTQPAAPDKSQPIYLCLPDYDFGIQIPKRNFVIPVQSSGPPSFPMQKRRIPIRLKIPALRELPWHLDSDFIVKGMAAVVSLRFQSLPVKIRKPILSRCNYEVLTSQLIAEERRGPTEVSTIILSYGDLPTIEHRKPERQMLIEKMLEQKSSLHEAEESFPAHVTCLADTEYDLDFAASFVSGVAFKPQSRVQDEASQLKTKAETAVSLCLMHRRTGLSLKAYFLSQLPDLSPLADFLLYLNLSFNCLCSFPTEVFYLKHLEVLKLRNNPIKFIPEEISQMKSLKYLVMSFNLLTTLPPGLFTLPNLEGLDVSYNELETIPNDIGNLSTLTYLNVEGNFLYVLPCGIVKLDLSRLKVENNFLHPYFWNEICCFEPQRLSDMAAHSSGFVIAAQDHCMEKAFISFVCIRIHTALDFLTFLLLAHQPAIGTLLLQLP